MCLDRGHKAITPQTMIQSGFKAFNPRGGAVLNFENFPYKNSHNVPMDQWIKAEGSTITGNGTYPAGFHIWTDETQLKGRGTHRVYFRGAHTQGTQDNKTVVVASEMYVPSDPDGWPPAQI